MTRSNLWIRGVYRDVVEDAEGGVVYDSGWVSNTIATSCRVLLASFINNDPTANGLRYLAVGRGEDAWDSDGAPAPDPDVNTTLVQAYEPPIDVADLEVVYLNAAGEVQEEPTSCIRITATLEADYPQPVTGLSTYPLREFGLFGELGGVPYMLNNVRHPRIDKAASETLIRVVRLSF